MKALLFRETGEPRKVLRLEEIGEKEPGSDEVSLRVFFSPVNPSDLQMVRGRYGYQGPVTTKVCKMATLDYSSARVGTLGLPQERRALHEAGLVP